MTNIKKAIYMVIGSGLTLAIAAGAFFFVGTTFAANDVVENVNAFVSGEEMERRGRRGGQGPKGDPTALADALGIPVEELEAANDAVKAAKLAAAVDAGIITEDEAAEIEAGEARLPKSALRDAEFEFDKEAALADALGVTIEELESAKESAKAAQLAQLVEDGVLTQAEADAILSGEAEFGRGGRGEGRSGRGFNGPQTPDVDGDDA